MTHSHTTSEAALYQEIGKWLTDLLMLDRGRPRRVGRMSTPGETKRDRKTGQIVPRGKYEDIPKSARFKLGDLLDHARGRVTWSCTLDQSDLSYSGVIEIDAGGRDALVRTLAACEARGIIAFAFEQIGKDHKGGHVWFLFSKPALAADILALCRAIAADAGLPANTELWPQNQGIRPPFGYHQSNQTWGNLLLQSGEIINLDTELAAGFAAVCALPRNSAPPAAPVETKPTRPKAAPQAQVTTTESRQRTSTGCIDSQAIGAAVRARFNAEHNWPELLNNAGGTELRDGWQCNCGYTHSHSVQIAITSRDKIVSYSPNCGWAPHKDSGKALDKFGFAIAQTYHGSYQAAVEVLARQYGLWVELKHTKRQQAPLSDKQLEYSPAEVARRREYNDKRRAARHAETLAALEALYDRVCNLSFTSAVPVGVNPEKHADRTRLLLIYLYGLAMESGCLQVAPTNEKIAAELGWCERYVVYGFRELEASGTGKRQGGKSAFGNQPNQAATWTFFREPSPIPMPVQPGASDAPNLGCKPDCDAECTPLYRTSNTHDLIKEHVRGGAQPAQVDSDAPAPKAECHQAAPEGASASYQPEWAMEWSDKPYTGASKHLVDFETRWAWSNEAIKPRNAVVDVADLVEQAEIVPISPAKTRQKSNEGIVSIDRYHAKIARMTVAELRAEKRKQENTICKHAKAFWVREVREKLALVEWLLAEAQSQSKAGVGCAPPLTSWRAAPQPTSLQQTGFL